MGVNYTYIHTEVEPAPSRPTTRLDAIYHVCASVNGRMHIGDEHVEEVSS